MTDHAHADPFSIEHLTADHVAFGETVLYLPNATYPVHIRGLGGRAVGDARALRDDLDRAVRHADGATDEAALDQSAADMAHRDDVAREVAREWALQRADPARDVRLLHIVLNRLADAY